MLRSVLGTIARVVALCLLALVGAVPSASASDDVASLPVHPEWGSVTGISGVLKKSCKTYYFNYSVNPPEGEWAIEFFITDPAGAAVANDARLDGGDPLSGSIAFKLCRNVTQPGTFTIRSKVSSERGSNDIIEGQLPPATFTLGVRAKKVYVAVDVDVPGHPRG